MKYPYCDKTMCQGYHVCQSEKQIKFRAMDQSREAIELFEMCQQLQTQFELEELKKEEA